MWAGLSLAGLLTWPVQTNPVPLAFGTSVHPVFSSVGDRFVVGLACVATLVVPVLVASPQPASATKASAKAIAHLITLPRALRELVRGIPAPPQSR